MAQVSACVRVVSPQASTFQMAILLQFNTENSYTVQQLADSTQIKIVSVVPLLYIHINQSVNFDLHLI